MLYKYKKIINEAVLNETNIIQKVKNFFKRVFGSKGEYMSVDDFIKGVKSGQPPFEKITPIVNEMRSVQRALYPYYKGVKKGEPPIHLLMKYANLEDDLAQLGVLGAISHPEIANRLGLVMWAE